MEASIKNDLVVVDFPFSDGGGLKRRPALVLAPEKEDVIVCRITSTKSEDGYSVVIKESQLKRTSFIRVNKIFTVHKNKILYKIGKINEKKQLQIKNKLIKLFS